MADVSRNGKAGVLDRNSGGQVDVARAGGVFNAERITEAMRVLERDPLPTAGGIKFVGIRLGSSGTETRSTA